ncbi:MAG TPA: hypothetical protein VGP68_23035, partial [Gemmataceae bacterium]|nr:hypothetical protein [Gemmataceae bacterium]
MLISLAAALGMAMGGLDSLADLSGQSLVKSQSPLSDLAETVPEFDESPDSATDPAIGLPGSFKQAAFGAPADFSGSDMPLEANQSEREPDRARAQEPKPALAA